MRENEGGTEEEKV